MQVDDLATVLARRKADPRDRPTEQHRADKPEEPSPRRSVDLGGALSHYKEDELLALVDPAAITDRARAEEKATGRIIDIIA
ncbi:MAG: hypothetical protein WDM79_05840 [Terricaulis sp.]